MSGLTYGRRLFVRARPCWRQSAPKLGNHDFVNVSAIAGRGMSSHVSDASFDSRRSFSDDEVLHMDNHMLWINKPAGLLSQGDRTGDVDVLELGREYVRVAANKPGDAFVAMVHRLDRPVSGVMCVARTSKAAARLSASFRDRDAVEKIYHAVVTGELTGSGTQDDLLASTESIKKASARGRGPRMAVVRYPRRTNEGTGEAEGGAADQRAVMKWKAVCCLNASDSPVCRPSGGGEDRPHTLVRIKLVTGRKHQIRAQLAAMGHPVVGDVRYGGHSSKAYLEAKKHRAGDRVTVMDDYYDGGIGAASGSSALKDRSILLHASELAVPHPTRPGETVRMRAPPPATWVEQCGKGIMRLMTSGVRRTRRYSR